MQILLLFLSFSSSLLFTVWSSLALFPRLGFTLNSRGTLRVSLWNSMSIFITTGPDLAFNQPCHPLSGDNAPGLPDLSGADACAACQRLQPTSTFWPVRLNMEAHPSRPRRPHLDQVGPVRCGGADPNVVP